MNTKASEAVKRERSAVRARLLHKALEYAWTDFADDVSRSLAGPVPSMAMEWRIEWIGELSAVVGPISWKDIEVGLLESGWFQRVHGQLGYHVPNAEISEWLEERGKPLEEPADG